MSITGKKINVHGIDLNVYIEGEGPPVLLLHGFPDSNELWRGIIPLLVSAGYQVIAPDQRGFGESDAPVGSKHYDMDQIASDSIALLNALGIEKAHLVGHDWGAMIGWTLACNYPEHFYDYTAISVGHLEAYKRAGWEQKRKGWYVLAFQLRFIAEMMFSAFNWAIFRKFARHHAECDHWIKDLSRPGRFTASLNWYRANGKKLFSSKTPNCIIPVMGIWSEHDMALAEDQMVNSANYVDNNFRYERLDGYSHWVPIDAPDEVSALILDFIGNDQP